MELDKFGSHRSRFKQYQRFHSFQSRQFNQFEISWPFFQSNQRIYPLWNREHGKFENIRSQFKQYPWFGSYYIWCAIWKLYGSCLHQRCMFLVYQVMEKGSLSCALRNDVEAVELWMKTLLTHYLTCIIIAIHQLFIETYQAILFCWIQNPSLLLLILCVARLLDPDTSNHTVLAGTYGYIAPRKTISSYRNWWEGIREISFHYMLRLFDVTILFDSFTHI
jgi:hypothetical protein